MNKLTKTKERNTKLAHAATLATGALAAAALLIPGRAEAATVTYASNVPGSGDIKVLNYALVLEDFQSAVYQAALNQLANILSAGIGNPVYNYLAEFALVEQDHAAYLRALIGSIGGTAVAPAFGNQYIITPITTATTQRNVLEFVLQVEAIVTRGYLGAIPLLTTASPYIQRLASIQSTEARHASTLTLLHNTLFITSTDVTPLPADNNLTGMFTYTSFKYEQYNAAGYNATKPNEGVIAIEANLAPDTVLTNLISPYLALSA